MASQRSEPVSGEIQAVSRASQILGLFAPEQPQLSVAEAAQRLGLNRTTVHRYFASLTAAGLLERGREPGSFFPGGLLLQLGVFALGRRVVMDLAPAHLASLSRATHLTSVLSLWGSSGPVVSRVEEDSTRPMLVTVRVGTQLGMDAAQTGVFLALLPDQLRVERLVGALPTDQRLPLTERINTVRATGVATAHLTDAGLTAVAAPVFDEYCICATVAVIGTMRTLPVSEPSQHWEDLKGTALALSKELGGDMFYPAQFFREAKW